MSEERVLVLAPLGRDGPLALRALKVAGLEAELCADPRELCQGVQAGAGAAVLTEEALLGAGHALLSATLERQPPWSDLPVIVFGTHEDRLLNLPGNVTSLDRPVRMRTLISAVRAALRARRRQYQVRELLSALEQSVRDRDQFLAMLGHELRNPLAAVLTASELMDSRAGTAFARERAVVNRQARNLSRLVDDLLDVSRVTRGKIPLHREPVDLREVAERAAAALARAARTQGVTVTLPAGGPVVVPGDPLRLEQVLANLISNAIKYTNAGGHIFVLVEREPERAVVRVKDSGVGISPGVLPRIFDLFTQAPGAIDRAQGGMGIGLTLMQRLVQLHGGAVEARSEGLGKGSEFVVRLPLSAPGESRPPPRDRRITDRPLRVLVAEDNPDARDVLQLALEQMGHHVEPCGDGQAAIARALSEKPDAMVIDLGLPGTDGFEVARAVRGALGAAVRLVALTGYGQPEDRERALAAGFDELLIKPAALEAVESALRSG